MPKFFCTICEAVSDQRRCEQHRNIRKKYVRKNKPTVSYAQQQYRKNAVNTYIQIYGYVCQGYRRPPHPSTDLTADHIVPTSRGGDEFGQLQIYCRSCNSSKNATIKYI